MEQDNRKYTKRNWEYQVFGTLVSPSSLILIMPFICLSLLGSLCRLNSSRLLNGNLLTGNLAEELGYLPNLDRIQIDENRISGPLPKSFANLNKTKHL